MIDSKKNILLFILCFITLFSIAQQIKNRDALYKYRAVHWGLENGLSQACVYHMLKDVNGFLWIGTQGGLSRGSMHKEDKGQLDIDVSEENNYLYFRITDNGVGRKKAAESQVNRPPNISRGD